MGEIRNLPDALAYLTPHPSTKGPVILTPEKMRRAIEIIKKDLVAGRTHVAIGMCPWDRPDDPRSDIPTTEPCPVCGMLGTPDAEDICIGGSRSYTPSLPSPTVTAEGN